jgi:protein involved in polysaccharide export with SLBB domain
MQSQACKLLLAATAALGAASASAQFTQNNNSTDSSGQTQDYGNPTISSQQQPSLTTIRSGFGSRTAIDFGTGAYGSAQGQYGTYNGQPCLQQGFSGAMGASGTGTGSAGGSTSGANSTGSNASGNASGGASGSGSTTNIIAPCPPGALPIGINSILNQNGPQNLLPPPYVPGEFELYVQGLFPMTSVRRLGAELMQGQPQQAPGDVSPLVPPDYLIVPGDELDVAVTGSIDAQAPLIVDRTGRVTIPHVGTIMVAGVRYADLPGLLTREVGRQFRNFRLSVALGQLRGMRVYLTGFVGRPGTYNLSSLSTVSAALAAAGGPTAAGSFRDIEVRRRGEVISKFDLYDLVITGKRDSDIVLQPEDVVHVGPVGAQVAILGSVNQAAIVELKPGDDLASALHMAGGLSSVADGGNITIEPLNDREKSRVVRVSLAEGGGSHALDRGDVVNVYSAVDARQPTVRQNKRVVVEGEVSHPGLQVLPPNATVADALDRAGGFTASAYIFGTEFTRESVRITQQQQYDKLLNDLQVDMQQNFSTHMVTTADEAKAEDARAASSAHLIDQLRKVRPTGRMVLLMDPSSKALPPLQIKDGDRIYVPPMPTTVGVFGSVFTAGNFLYSGTLSIGDYLEMAGGPKRGADKESEFVLRANGSVVSSLQDAGWFHKSALNTKPALPGDTIYVPEELNKLTGLETSKAWTEILYQFGLGIAGVAAALR